MDSPVEELRRLVESDSQIEVAKKLGISPTYLSDVVNERRPPGKKILSALGFQRRLIYERIPKKRRLEA